MLSFMHVVDLLKYTTKKISMLLSSFVTRSSRLLRMPVSLSLAPWPSHCLCPAISLVEILIADGMRLYVSDNKVILTEGFDGVVPVKYFEKIESWPDRQPISY